MERVSSGRFDCTIVTSGEVESAVPAPPAAVSRSWPGWGQGEGQG